MTAKISIKSGAYGFRPTCDQFKPYRPNGLGGRELRSAGGGWYNFGRRSICSPSAASVTSRHHAILNLFAGAIAVAVSGCAGPPVLERQVLGNDEVTKMLDEKLLLLNIARVPTEEPFTSRRPRALPLRLTGLQRSVSAVRSRSRREPISSTSTSVAARPRTRRSASLPFRVKNLPSGLRLPEGTKSSSSLYFKGVGSTKSCA